MAGERTLPGAGLIAGWTPGTGGYAAQMDADFRAISAAMQLGVVSKDSTLPGSPTDGLIYIMRSDDGTNPNKVAIRDNGAWVYLTPQFGWLAWVQDLAAFWYYNNSGAWVVLETGGGGGTTVGDTAPVTPADGDTWFNSETGEFSVYYNDGTSSQWVVISGAAAESAYILTGGFESVLVADEIFGRHVMTEAVRLVAGAPGALVKGDTAATGSTTITLKKNGISLGTVVFSAAGTTGAITVSADVDFAIGDVWTMVGPSTADATLAGVGASFRFLRI